MVLSGLVSEAEWWSWVCSITLTCLSSSSPLSCELTPRDALFGKVMILSQVERGLWRHGKSPCQRGGSSGSLGEQLCCACPHLPAAELPSFCPVLAFYPRSPKSPPSRQACFVARAPPGAPPTALPAALKVAARRKSQTCTRSKQPRAQSSLAGLPEGYKRTL